MVCVIKRDGVAVGIAESDEHGIGALGWFHANVSSSSMSHAIEHEGWSVETVDSVDCSEVESLIAAIAARLGVTMTAEFVPFSQSRNAKGDKPWRSLNWRVSFARYGREFLATDYSQGEAHAPTAKKTAAQMETAARVMGRTVATAKKLMIDFELESGRIAKSFFGHSGLTGREPIPAPGIGDVLQCLVRDSDALDYGGFDDWASEFGYDTDSRSAESIYRACLEIGTKMRAGIGERGLAELRLAASFN